MILKKIEEKLLELDNNVLFGAGRFREKDDWNCLVFGRRRLKTIQNGNGYTHVYFVAIVREDFIEDGLEMEVIKKMREAGLKKTDAASEYGYVEKSGECMVEICTMEFYKTLKECEGH